jgi:hypothetical protein
MAINNAEISGCGFSPFYLNYGFHPCVWPDVEHAAPRDLTVQEDVKSFVRRMDSTWDSARSLLDSASTTSIDQANRHRRAFQEFPVGSRVLVRILPKRQSALFPVGLLTPKWAGPFVIQAKVSANTYRLDIPGPRHWNRTYVFNASALKPFLSRALPVTTGALEGPGDVDNDYDSRLDPEVAMEVALPQAEPSPAESAADQAKAEKLARDLATSRFWINKWFPPGGSPAVRLDPALLATLSMGYEPPASDVEQVLLDPNVFSAARHFLKFKPSADMFASSTHHQLPRYYSKDPEDFNSAGLDAFRFNWKAEIAPCFNPP